MSEGPSANAEIRQYGRRTRWIVRVCEADRLEAVEARFGGLLVEELNDGTLLVEDPDYGPVRFRKDGVTEAQGRVIAPQDYSVRGEAALL